MGFLNKADLRDPNGDTGLVRVQGFRAVAKYRGLRDPRLCGKQLAGGRELPMKDYSGLVLVNFHFEFSSEAYQDVAFGSVTGCIRGQSTVNPKLYTGAVSLGSRSKSACQKVTLNVRP